MSFVFTLVHGTRLGGPLAWGKNRGWIERGEPIRQVLESVFDGSLVHPFRWSGWNSVQARSAAAKSLANHIRGVARDYPQHQHVLIGHSHGGSVIFLALQDEEAAANVHGVITMATPFLLVNNTPPILGVVAQIAIGMALVFFGLMFIVVYAVLGGWRLALIASVALLLTMATKKWGPVGCRLANGIEFCWTRLRNWREWVVEHARSTTTLGQFTGPTLLLRMSGDEA